MEEQRLLLPCEPMSKRTTLDEIAEEATLNHLYHRNLLLLEAVISAMLDVHDHKDVATILREHADQLEEYL